MLPPAPRSALPWFTPQQTAEERDNLRGSSLTSSARNAKITRYSVRASYHSLSFSAAGYRLLKARVGNNALAFDIELLFFVISVDYAYNFVSASRIISLSPFGGAVYASDCSMPVSSIIAVL